jgi:hypothetical protein
MARRLGGPAPTPADGGRVEVIDTVSRVLVIPAHRRPYHKNVIYVGCTDCKHSAARAVGTRSSATSCSAYPQGVHSNCGLSFRTFPLTVRYALSRLVVPSAPKTPG